MQTLSYSMKKYLLTFLTLICLDLVMLGQDLEKTAKNEIDVNLGYQKNFLKDLNLSPLNQVGGGLATLLKYKRTSKNIWGATIQFSTGNIISGPKEQEFSTLYINANIELNYLFKIPQEKLAYQFYVGPVYNTRVLYLDWYDLDAFSFVATHGIGIKGMVSKKINDKHLIQSSLAIPVFQFLSRPPYNGIDEFIIENQDSPAKIIFNGSPSSFNNYFALEFSLDYKYNITPHIDWMINYMLFTHTVKEANHFKSLSNSITTGIAINF